MQRLVRLYHCWWTERAKVLYYVEACSMAAWPFKMKEGNLENPSFFGNYKLSLFDDSNGEDEDDRSSCVHIVHP
jgi:hypothetical protein